LDNIFESLLSSSVIETPQSAKDKKQKNKYPQTRPKVISEKEVLSADIVNESNNAEVWQDEERRNGDERRQEHSERGRYFESRNKSNRRTKKELHIKI